MKLLNRINTVLLQMTYSLLVKSQKTAGQIVTIGCVLFLIGCDTDHSNNDVANSNNDVAPERAQLVKTTPAVSEIERYTPKMELVFDKPVAQVEVTAVSEIEPHTPKMELVVNKSGTQVKVTAVSKIIHIRRKWNSFSISRGHSSKSMRLMLTPTQQCRSVLGSQQRFGHWI